MEGSRAVLSELLSDITCPVSLADGQWCKGACRCNWAIRVLKLNLFLMCLFVTIMCMYIIQLSNKQCLEAKG